MRRRRRAHHRALQVSEPGSPRALTATSQGGDPEQRLGGRGLGSHAHDLAVGADRRDHIAMGVEEPGDAQVLETARPSASGLSHAVESWFPIGT
jgi:hypothetical protein